MVFKGRISNKDKANRTAMVIIPELDNSVTPMIPIAIHIDEDDLSIGQNCVVALFSKNLADGAIIAIF